MSATTPPRATQDVPSNGLACHDRAHLGIKGVQQPGRDVHAQSGPKRYLHDDKWLQLRQDQVVLDSRRDDRPGQREHEQGAWTQIQRPVPPDCEEHQCS
jgi:hypothetical protein